MTRLGQNVFVIWQSLVVRGYRSPFELLARQGYRVGLCGPLNFRELGGQARQWEDPAPPNSNPSHWALKARTFHTQAVWLFGLRNAISRFFREECLGPRTILCVAEPYSLTALFIWFATLSLGNTRPYRLVTFTCQNIDKRHPLPLRLIEKFIFKVSDAIWSVSRGQTTVLRAHGYRGPVWEIPLWYDSGIFKAGPRINLGLESVEKALVRVGFAGSFFEEKGLQHLLDAWLSSGTLLQQAALFTAGGGPLQPKVEETLREITTKGGQGKHCGSLSPQDMASFFQSIDILVVPSLTRHNWKEQFGRVIVEALACGVYVVGSDSGEIPQIIRNPQRIFAEGNVEALRCLLEGTVTQLAKLDIPERRALSSREWGLACSDKQVAALFNKHIEELSY